VIDWRLAAEFDIGAAGTASGLGVHGPGDVAVAAAGLNSCLSNAVGGWLNAGLEAAQYHGCCQAPGSW